MKRTVIFAIYIFVGFTAISQKTLPQKFNQLASYSLRNVQHENGDWLLGNITAVPRYIKARMTKI
ncbi:MAG: hypothetical protein M3R50_09075 [Bacteroidota bacterium]|nr:hypothetical protein [Bacteroidota bacterium]